MTTEIELRQPDRTSCLDGFAGNSWIVNIYDEPEYTSWLLFLGTTTLCVAYGVLHRDHFEVMKRVVGPVIPRITKSFQKAIEFCVRGR